MLVAEKPADCRQKVSGSTQVAPSPIDKPIYSKADCQVQKIKSSRPQMSHLPSAPTGSLNCPHHEPEALFRRGIAEHMDLVIV